LTQLDADVLPPAFVASSVESVTSSLSFEVENVQHWSRYRAKQLFYYSLNYTDTLSDSSTHLDTWAWGQLLMWKGDISTLSKLQVSDHPLRFRVFANYTDFLDQPALALGYTRMLEIGLGVSWEYHIKPFDWLGLRSFGLSAGYTTGEDLSGYNIGFYVQ